MTDDNLSWLANYAANNAGTLGVVGTSRVMIARNTNHGDVAPENASAFGSADYTVVWEQMRKLIVNDPGDPGVRINTLCGDVTAMMKQLCELNGANCAQRHVRLVSWRGVQGGNDRYPEFADHVVSASRLAPGILTVQDADKCKEVGGVTYVLPNQAYSARLDEVLFAREIMADIAPTNGSISGWDKEEFSEALEIVPFLQGGFVLTDQNLAICNKRYLPRNKQFVTQGSPSTPQTIEAILRSTMLDPADAQVLFL